MGKTEARAEFDEAFKPIVTALTKPSEKELAMADKLADLATDLATGHTPAADEQEATATPPEQDGEAEDTHEAETPQKPKKAAPPSMEERMLDMLLREKHPDTLATALANGKTIHGAWNYVVSVMKNAYITAHGRVNGGMCGTPEVVVGIAERYLREFPEGYTEPEAAHTPKKPSKTDGKANAAKTAVATVKAAATSAKDEAKRKRDEMMKKWQGEQLSLF